MEVVSEESSASVKDYLAFAGRTPVITADEDFRRIGAGFDSDVVAGGDVAVNFTIRWRLFVRSLVKTSISLLELSDRLAG
ncbi:hypothetical protein ACOZ32_00480 [Halobacterium sp. MBLA0001]|uniref:hypothetical protein n=1 Tax=Halobacterium sp. MBLA0001 TaxID=3413511 RepID=UPI003C70FF7D